MFAKTKEKLRLKARDTRRFLRSLELPFPDSNLSGKKCETSIEKDAIKIKAPLLKIRFKFPDIISARRETYKGGPISWRLMRWGRCPKGTQGIRILLRSGLFRNHFITFSDLTRAEQELKYRKVLFR